MYIYIYIYIYIYLHNICIYEIHKHDIHNKNIYGGGMQQDCKECYQGRAHKKQLGICIVYID